MAIEHCKGNANGLGLVNQGKEHTVEELGDFDESKVKRVSSVSYHTTRDPEVD
jgi:xanthine dioxygenase